MQNFIGAQNRMPDLNLTTLVSAAIPLVAVFAPVWPAMKAKKLGKFHYRWGVYVAAEALIASFSFSVDALRSFAAKSPWQCAAFFVMSILAIGASAGLFKRRRWGVIAFIGVSVISLTLPSAYALFGPHLRGKITGEGIFVFVFLAISAQYFRRRWAVMDRL